MVFRKGGKLARNEQWSYAGSLIDVVQSFTYVGVCFFSSLSLTKMANENATKGKRALNGILLSLYKYGQLSNSVFFKLFDSKIGPVLLHGSEIWGYQELPCIESVHRHACKRYVCVGEKTSNITSLGDCGRYPIVITSQIRCIKYWLKIIGMPDTRYVKKCYNFLLNTNINLFFNWANEIKDLLSKNGFQYIWMNQHVSNPLKFINEFRERAKSQYLQNWWSIVHTSPKLELYKHIKSQYEHEAYLDILSVRKFRRSFAQLRSGTLPIEIETGRYRGITREQRFCPICNTGEVENELHFILKCPVLHDIRKTYIQRKFFINPSILKLGILLSSKNEQTIKQTASYIVNALETRTLILEL